MASPSLDENDVHPIEEQGVETIESTLRLKTQALLEKTRYGEQLCTIGALNNSNINEERLKHLVPVVVRQALHPSELNPPQFFSSCILSPFATINAKKYKADFVAYKKENFEMTLGWNMKVHKKEIKNSLSLDGQCIIEPVWVLRPDGKWVLSETFQDFFFIVRRTVGRLHEKAYTHGHLVPNNIVIEPVNTMMYSSRYKAVIINCLQHHDLEKDEEKESFEALVKKDWNDVLKLIENATSGMDPSCFDDEFTQFLNKLATFDCQTLNKKAFDHPGIWVRERKKEFIENMSPRFAAKKMSELGFLESGVDWRKLVDQNILKESQKEADGWMHFYREDYDGEFNDSIHDCLCFIKDSYSTWKCDYLMKDTGYSAMDFYLQSLFPDLFVKLYQLEGTDAFHKYKPFYE